MEQSQAPQDQIERPAANLRRAWVRGLGRRMTAIEKTTLVHAAKLTVRAAMLAKDPAAPVLELCRVTREAERARGRAFAMLGLSVEGKPEAAHIPLRERLAGELEAVG
jgi:hypothetical protein